MYKTQYTNNYNYEYTERDDVAYEHYVNYNCYLDTMDTLYELPGDEHYKYRKVGMPTKQQLLNK